MKNSQDLNKLSALNTQLIYLTQLKSSLDMIIVYHNVRPFNKNADRLLLYLPQLRTNINVIVLTETWFSPLYTGPIPGYVKYFFLIR